MGFGAGAKMEKGTRLALENQLIQASNRQLTENTVKAALQNRANKEVIDELKTDYENIANRFDAARARMRVNRPGTERVPETGRAASGIDDAAENIELFTALREAEQTAAKLQKFQRWAKEQHEIYNRKVTKK